ncbi:MAG: hypothetical protein UV64_C0001G0002 [Parcubacteria group bacterium GW2011_GWC1_43_11b]|uniref:Uncharacterized protein n=2 Tax=Candidatus Vogeliibacteriota TaxID=1817922 RepID=A0A1G2QH00_9BACT|nr:MAG: hypothetical protein UV50_C0008G0028 [Parcubacteria group bacterium GW2011_GWB1_42_9]KKS89743.1 MAG: hypothetical protein UV64_C0001G0002 [Parcubacteria group bacterium GW2011_GWC1_43_11b]KKT09659.1 MAG: hypothetical protein UV88_C0006G0010 [Parcubacteria group bacterium GW2011_GWA1_43_21]OHA58708.1 MAG: hypothetical protein A2607_01395 [Candidatus Vogelbacteria bacterium RIFOXYD1_FULL_42_15]OHA59292.1 MAG: hypothetical protein A2370_01955 [Candidatus Vogelbacteria bacterium RIFOXYB1_FU
MPNELHENCKRLIRAFESGKLGQTYMPEDQSPNFSKRDFEKKIAYFTLPMALNYQRDSYKLWEAVLKTWSDEETKWVFDIGVVSETSDKKLRSALMKYKIALQPNKHIKTWRTIARNIKENWGSFTKFIKATKSDYLILKQVVRTDNKKGFPYLSGPKIFNYWSFIISTYCGVQLKNRDYIEIAPDTHITQCSVKLGVISAIEAKSLTKDEISERWRNLLKGSKIDPIDMHSPLWFWSHNGFIFKL